MESIYKRITIEPFRCRVVNSHDGQETAINRPYPYFTAGTVDDTIKYAYDIEVADESLRTILPTVSDSHILRYKTFCDYYYLCIDYEENAKIYKKCINGKWRKEGDITKETDYPIYASTDEIGEDFNGDRVVIYSNAEYLKAKFTREETRCRDINAVSSFCKNCFGNKDIKKTKPYANVSVYLSSEINDQGRLEYAIPEWAGGKKYMAGQYVTYSKNIYRAKTDIDINIKTDGTFETPADENSGWGIVTQAVASSEKVAITGISEQRSAMFLSKKKYLMEEYGASGNRIVTEYPFYEKDGKFYFPYIKREVNVGDGAARLEEICFNTQKVTDSEVASAYTFDEIFKNCGDDITSVMFKYSLYDECENKDNINWDNAIRYEETYAATTTATTSGIKYFYIETGETQTVSNNNSDLAKEERNVNFAAISYMVDKEKISKEERDKLNFFIKISPIGSQDIKTNVDAEIDRGSCALFERMNILEEVKSIRDLEKYRNNYFDI